MGVVETYVVRTALAAIMCVALFPPRDVARADIPRLLGPVRGRDDLLRVRHPRRAAGSPVVVQTLVATTPLFVLAVESVRRRAAPPVRAVAAALIVVVGVVLILVA